MNTSPGRRTPVKSCVFAGVTSVAIAATVFAFAGPATAAVPGAVHAAAATSPSTNTVGWVTVGRSVTQIQALVGTTQDGIYGPLTTAAVKRFQASHGLVVDGIWGPLTDAAAFGTASSAYSGYPLGYITVGGWTIKQVQALVGVTQDGIYGPQTTAAVKKWQAAHGLVADGIVGPLTSAAGHAAQATLTALKPATAKPATTKPAVSTTPKKTTTPAHKGTLELDFVGGNGNTITLGEQLLFGYAAYENGKLLTSGLTWSVTGLPAGVTVSHPVAGAALIDGTPTTAGSYTISLRVTADGQTVGGTIPVTVTAPAPVPTVTVTSPDTTVTATAGTPFTETFTAAVTGTNDAVTWSTNPLPTGLTGTVNPDGTYTVSGSTTVAGTDHLNVTATVDGVQGTSAFTLTVTPAPTIIEIASEGVPPATAGDQFAETFEAVTANTSDTVTWSTGTLPGGLIGHDNGNDTYTVIGTAPAAGSYQISLTATVDGVSDSSTFPLTVTAPSAAPTITSVTPNVVSTAGGDTVTLTGTGFTGTDEISVGGPTVSFTVVSDNEITLVTPAMPAGTFDIMVVTDHGSVTAPASITFSQPAG